MKRVSIVGSGYVGLVTGAGLAEFGHEVVCVDVDDERIATINEGRIPFHEPGLEELVRKHSGGRLRGDTNLAAAVEGSDITFIAVGTPSLPDGAIDLSHVISAAQGIGEILRGKDSRHLVVTKSTVVPGTTASVIIPTLESASGSRAGDGFSVAVNPEFLTEGSAVDDFLRPDRIVIGANEPAAADEIEELYAPLTDVPFVVTTPSTAEFIKYASNALLATMISFSNELSNLSEAIDDVDIVDVMRGVHNSRYLKTGDSMAAITSFLEAGCGFGGSCLPKDTGALIAHGDTLGVGMPLLKAVIDTNSGRAEALLEILRRHHGNLHQLPVTVLGLAFKPDTDDTRESPSFAIVDRLLGSGARVRVHDPAVSDDALPAHWRGQVVYQRDIESALTDTRAVIIVTRWEEYKGLPNILERMGISPLVIDGRRMLSPDSVAKYDGIGR